VDRGDGVASDLRGESRWPAIITVVVAIVVPLLLPARFSLGPKWLGPSVLVLILVAVSAADPGRIDRRSAGVRALWIGLAAILVMGAATTTVALVVEIINRDHRLANPTTLLASGALVWVNNVIAFTFLYWSLDGGGPGTRAHESRTYPDFAFPEHMSPELAPPGWRPLFLDYLYLSLTDATAFSPTDVMPLRHWAKLLMAVQALLSLVVLGLVIARAVNILT
jgi:uncharacterized membrane protein